MPEVNLWAIVASVVAWFVVSMVWYAALGKQYAEVSEAAREAAGSAPPPAKLAVEALRGLAVSVVLAGLAAGLDITSLGGALGLGLALWIAFPVVLLVGSVQWERVPWQLGAIHAGDWLVKLLLISCIVSLWR